MKKSTRAVAYTVLRSPVLTRFSVQLLRNAPVSGIAHTDLLLGRARGGAIEKVGGVPAGASGSPVFVERRLVGAVSHLLGSDPFLVGITPIKEMLQLAKEPTAPLPRTEKQQTERPSDNLYMAVANGFHSSVAKDRLRSHYNSVFVSCSNTAKPRRIGCFFSGSPVGAAMMIGDLRLGFIGTVTCVRGRELFAFGHPLLFAGPCQYPLTAATIVTTARGDFPNKIGVLGEVLGTVLQDRGAGIFGLLGQMPVGLVDVTLSVTDEDRKADKKNKVQIVHNPSELPFLAYIAALETISQAMNRAGEGTAKWEWVVRIEGETDAITVSDEQYSASNIGALVAWSVFPILEEPLSMGLQVTSVALAASVTMSDQTN